MTTFGWVLLGIAGILVVLAAVSAFQGSSDGFGDALMWAFSSPDGAIAAVFPPLDRRFAVTQTHWFGMRDGMVAEHWANRDDLGMGSSSDGRPRPRRTSPACCWRDAA